MSESSDLHSAWASLFARGLATSGVRDVVLSPGSRSTPLALAFARETDLRVTPIVDERDAAFFALGQARVSGRPSVLVCTSGTAAAHYLPAIVEASQAHVPLVAVTADRPWELVDAAAPQTIDQTKLFGDHVRWFAELGLPDVAALPHVLRIAARAVATSLHPTPGPVHVNARFRKPLEPVRGAGREAFADELERFVRRGAPRVIWPEPTCGSEAVARVASAIERSSRVLIALGPTSSARFAQPEEASRLRRAVRDLARAAGAAVFAEAASQARFGEETSTRVVSGFDALIASGGVDAPDLVIELLSPPTSSAYASLAQRCDARIVVAEHGFPDPHGTATDVILGCPVALLDGVARALRPSEARRVYALGLEERGRVVEAHAEAAAAAGLTEPAIARELVAALPEGAVLVIGNSLPIRDLDAFGGASPRAITVLHQRGASGIDGLVAGAAGARTVADARSPVVLLLGDVSALHDLGGFVALASVRAPLVVVVVDNGGGRIFEELPIAKDPSLSAELERLFVTPRSEALSGLVGAVARGVSATHVEATTREAFVAALREGLASDRATVIEARVPEGDGRARRAAHLAALRETFAARAR